jgi:hypothetical protein
MPQPNPINSFGRESGVALQSQITTLNTWTGSSTGIFYPYNNNPSGYVREISGSIYTTGFTGNILDGQVLIGSTGSNAYVAGHINGVSGIVTQSGSGRLIISTDVTIVKTGQTGALTNQFYPLSSNPANYLTSASLGGVSMIVPTGTANSGQISGNVIITGAGTVTTYTGANGIIIISGASVAGPGGSAGVNSIAATGATNTGFFTGDVMFTGAGNVVVSTGTPINKLIVVSGNTGAYANFVTLSQTGNVVNTSQTGGFLSFKVTGSPLLPLVNLTGASNTVVTTGGGGLVITSGSITPSFQYADFSSNTSNPTYLEGRLFYDTGEKSLAYYNDNGSVTQNLGQENWIRVINVSNLGIPNGKVVYITGAVSGLPAISPAQANSESGSFAVGVTTVDIPQSGRGYVTTMGVVHTINVSGFIPGTKIYLSETTTGAFTNTRTTGNTYIKPIGYVISTGISGLSGHVLVVPSDNYRPDNFYLSGSGLVSAGNIAISILPTGAIISGNTGAYANFVSLGQTGGFLTLGNVGGVRTLQTTGAFPSGFTSGNIVISGAGTISVTTGVNASIIISGTAGQQQVGSAAGVNTLGVTGIINTGYFTGDVLISGAAGITAYTGANKVLIISGTPLNSFSGLHNVWIPAGAMTPSVITGATTGTIFTSGSGQSIDVLDFLSGSGQSAYFNLTFPEVWNKSTVYPVIYWTTTGNANGTINWGIAAGDIKDGGNLNIQYNQGTTITDTAISGNFLHQTTGAPLTISGSLADDDNCYFKVYRSAGGSLALPGRLIGLNLEYHETGLNSSITAGQGPGGSAGVSSIIATGITNTGYFTGDVMFSGAGSVVVSTGNQTSKVIVISGTASASNTGELTGVFYPLNDNPSGYISTASGILTLSGASGIQNGQLLIGSIGDSAFIQGNLVGVSGIVVSSGSGSLTIGANLTGAHEVWIPANAITPGAVAINAPIISTLTTGNLTLDTLDFPQTGYYQGHFTYTFPNSWNNSVVKGQFYWTESGVTGTTGTVVWGLAGAQIKNNGIFNIQFDTGQLVTGVSSTGLRMHKAVTPFLTISGNPVNGDPCFFKVYRNSGSLSGSAKLIGISLQYYHTGITSENY